MDVNYDTDSLLSYAIHLLQAM